MTRWLAFAVIVLAMLLGASLFWLWPDPEPEPLDKPVVPFALSDAGQIERGAYLAQLGDCKPCHTRRGGVPFAGGRPLPTAFGTFYAPNITPDPEQGIGRWSSDDFWRALHDGRGREGQPLYPAFPYTNYTRITREDADAVYAYLRSLPPAPDARREHDLRSPYQHRILLVAWRLLFFRSGEYQADVSRSPEWNRGGYLVQGLGHCSACHEARNRLGAIKSKDNPAGGLVQSWYAPSLYTSGEAGVQKWTREEIAAFLRDGKTEHAAALGPMAEVVYESLQHLAPSDADAIAQYLMSLPERKARDSRGIAVPRGKNAEASSLARAEELYAQHCAECHGDEGEGRPSKAAALTGNRSILMGSIVNAVRVIQLGGYPPGTRGNPRPYGMPPFAEKLTDEDVAAILTYLRRKSDPAAADVDAAEVKRRGGGLEW